MGERRRWGLWAGTVGVSVAWCGWASQYRAFTAGGKATWAVSLALVAGCWAVIVGRARRAADRIDPSTRAPWPRPGPDGARRTLAGTWPWLALGVVVVAWEVLGLDTGPHEPHLTLSALVLFSRPFRAAVLWAWMAAGWALGRAWGPTWGGSGQRAGRRLAGGDQWPVVVAPLALGLLLPDHRSAGFAFWGAVAAVGVVLDRVGRRSDGRWASFFELLAGVGRSVGVRLLVTAGWVYAGWHLFAH